VLLSFERGRTQGPVSPYAVHARSVEVFVSAPTVILKPTAGPTYRWFGGPHLGVRVKTNAKGGTVIDHGEWKMAE
jgi:hypothetical protein